MGCLEVSESARFGRIGASHTIKNHRMPDPRKSALHHGLHLRLFVLMLLMRVQVTHTFFLQCVSAST